MGKKLIVSDIVVASLLLLIIGGFLFFHWNSFRRWRNWQFLDEQGVQHSATILDLNLTVSVRSVTNCRVQYEYQFEGQKYQDNQEADSSFCVNNVIGDEISILLLTNQPSRSNLGVWSQGPIQLQWLLIALVDGVIVLGIGGYWITQRLTHKSQNENTKILNQVEAVGFPIILNRPKGDAVMDWGCVLPFGLLVTFGLLLAIILMIQQASEQGWGLAVVGICSGTPFLAFGLFLLYMFFMDTAVSYTFSQSNLKINYRIGEKELPVEQMKAIAPHYRQTRGVEHHFLRLTLIDEKTIEINVPRENFKQVVQLIRAHYPLDTNDT